MSDLAPTRAEIDACRVRMERERAERLACPDCKAVMEYVATLSYGSDTGYGAEYLMQCPKCKTVAVKDQM